MKSHKALRLGILATAATALSLSAVSPASADSYVYYNGSYGAGTYATSALKWLTRSDGLSNDGRTICVDAIWPSGTQYGSVICTNNSTGTHNSYNGGQQLAAYSRPTTGNGVNAKVRATYW